MANIQPGPAIEDGIYNPANFCCNSPCPPGAFCNTECCNKQTEFWVQKWTCAWQLNKGGCGGPAGMNENSFCGYTKVWKCGFYPTDRCSVLKGCKRPKARCPCPEMVLDCNGDPVHAGECECFVPEDVYFAKVYTIEYHPCITEDPMTHPAGFIDIAHATDSCVKEAVLKDPDNFGCHDGEQDTPAIRVPAGRETEAVECAPCCGLYQICKPRWIRIFCKADIPPDFPYAEEPAYYERTAACCKPAPPCAGAACRVGPNASKSPNFWLEQSRIFA